MASYEDVRSLIEDRIKLAYKISGRYGYIIGFVSRVKPVEIIEDKRIVDVEIPYDKYVEAIENGCNLSIGGFIGITNPLMLRVYLARIIGFKREDIMSIANIPAMQTPASDASGLLTSPSIKLELLSERIVDLNGNFKSDTQPALTPIEPQSPVFIPNEEFILEMLNLPKDGVRVGWMRVGNTIYNIDVRIPERILQQHVLLVGTTGAGKTTILKNLILSLCEDLKSNNPLILAFDMQGDYLHVIIDGALDDRERVLNSLDEITVILPITNEYADYLSSRLRDRLKLDPNALKTLALVNRDEFARRIIRVIVEELCHDFIRRTYAGIVKVLDVDIKPNYELARERGFDIGAIMLKEILLNLKFEYNGKVLSKRVKIIPIALKFEYVRKDFKDLIPIVSEQAYYFIDRVFEELKRRQHILEYLSEYYEYLNRRSGEVSDELKLAKPTLNNILRCLLLALKTDIFDVFIKIGRLFGILIGEPKYDELYSSNRVIIADFRMLDPLACTIIAYRLLNELFKWKDRLYVRGVYSNPSYIIIDEAHNYFPQTGARRELNKTIIESLINKITRLGRVRNIGVIFATHTPSDLNDLVIQLTNTKIGLRSESKILERIGIREYAEELIYAPDGFGVILSPAYRTHYISFKSYPPQVYHRG